MRVALVTESFAPRGDDLADSCRHVVDGLLAAGHEVLVVAPAPGQARYRGVRVVRARRLVPVGAMLRLLESFAPDLVHLGCHAAPGVLGTLALRAAGRLDVPAVVVTHRTLDATSTRWWDARWSERVRPGATYAVGTCPSSTRELVARGVPAGHWSPGTAHHEFHPGLRDPELHAHWSRWPGSKRPGRLVVGHLGATEKEKVRRRLVDLAGLEGVAVVVLGGGTGAQSLRHHGVRVMVDLGGLELARAVASLDVLVQPRQRESAVGGVRRALASGVPVVAWDRAGAADVVTHEVDGLLVDLTGPTALMGAVERLARDRGLLARLAAGAQDGTLEGTTRGWAESVTELVDVHYCAATRLSV